MRNALVGILCAAAGIAFLLSWTVIGYGAYFLLEGIAWLTPDSWTAPEDAGLFGIVGLSVLVAFIVGSWYTQWRD